MIWIFLVYLGLRLFLIGVGIEGIVRLKRLKNFHVPDLKTWPKVSFLIPARNEERNIEKALLSVLALDYPEKEILLVEDRSTDKTPLIVEGVKKKHPELQVIHVKELPKGWLGKNHALQKAAERASGEYLLFTDADIVFGPRSMQRLVTFIVTEKLDHLTALPYFHSQSIFMRLFGMYFAHCFMTFFRPWTVRDPKSKRHIGIGAFNLVKKEKYFAAGGHAAIPLCADDDLKLGKLLKQSKAVSDIVEASDALYCEWHPRLRDCVRGLEKSILPGWDYQFHLAFFGFFGPLLMDVFPFIFLFFLEGIPQVLCIIMAAGVFVSGALSTWPYKFPFWYPFTLPISALVMSWAVLRNTFLPWWRGGLYWRETFYSLEELKAGVRK